MICSMRSGSIAIGARMFRKMWLPVMELSIPLARTSPTPISNAPNASTNAFSAEGYVSVMLLVCHESIVEHTARTKKRRLRGIGERRITMGSLGVAS